MALLLVLVLLLLAFWRVVAPASAPATVEGFAQAGAGAATTPTPAAAPQATRGGDELRCLVMDAGGAQVCVRRARDNAPEAAALLYANRRRAEQLITYLRREHGDNADARVLIARFRPETIEENLPTSQFTAVTTNKGEHLQFCLSPVGKQDNEQLVDPHLLFYVTLHEMAHVMDVEHGHEAHFWSCFHFLLQAAKDAGLHEPRDYRVAPAQYCGEPVTSSPYFSGAGGGAAPPSAR